MFLAPDVYGSNRGVVTFIDRFGAVLVAAPKYASLVANAIMLSNVPDQTEVLASMDADRHRVTPEYAAALSPYTRKHIRRFGK
ncbi:Tn3 family transposase [Phyllobacterium sp. P30BS-XVII]|uniref:Tn3 family transposase n=1 Tax=Phyllobacterium sp. P30BS-XVII TaxID=2587046 RepID=UPI000DDC7065|nr:Tn3 family transposase [Phyllobacterium sp. P30BS-XVII]